MKNRVVTVLQFLIPLVFAVAYPALSEYARSFLARVMILAIYSYGYAICFQMLGLLSLGHAALFAAGMYGAGLYTVYVSPDPFSALALGILAALSLSSIMGLLTTRSGGPYLMISTLLATQAIYLAALHFNDFTGGEQGIVLRREATLVWALSPWLNEIDARYFVSLLTLAITLTGVWVISSTRLGRLFLAARDDEEKLESLGYNTATLKLLGFILSGVLSGVAGALQALLYGYVGAGYAGVLNSVEPILWVLVGGPYIQIGPLLGCMLVNVVADFTRGLLRGHVLIVGFGLVLIAFATGRLSWAYRLLRRSRGIAP